MNRNKRSDSTSQKYIDEFLAKGGKITVCEPHARTENIVHTGGMWGRRKKAVPPPPPPPEGEKK